MALTKETSLIQLEIKIRATIEALDLAINNDAIPESDRYPSLITLQALLNMTHQAIEKAWKPGSI